MKNKIIVISVLIMMSIIFIAPKSYGALSSKPTTVTDGSNVVVNKTVSTAYALCQQMTSNGESLYGATVKPHLVTNKDWGAVSYLSNSIYGTNTAGKNTGIQITINGVTYYSTTGNASGVMNWGCNKYKTLYTQTAGLINNCVSSNTDILELYNNKDTEFVDYIDPTDSPSSIGMATHETHDWYYSRYYYAKDAPGTYMCSSRVGLFGCDFGDWHNGTNARGSGSDKTTFRPAIWN